MSFDISWDEVAEVRRRHAGINRVWPPCSTSTRSVPVRDRHRGAAGPAPYYAVFDMWAPVRNLLTPDASLKVRKGNYERIFDEGRRKVRAWEAANLK